MRTSFYKYVYSYFVSVTNKVDLAYRTLLLQLFFFAILSCDVTSGQ